MGTEAPKFENWVHVAVFRREFRLSSGSLEKSRVYCRMCQNAMLIGDGAE